MCASLPYVSTNCVESVLCAISHLIYLLAKVPNVLMYEDIFNLIDMPASLALYSATHSEVFIIWTSWWLLCCKNCRVCRFVSTSPTSSAICLGVKSMILLNSWPCFLSYRWQSFTVVKRSRPEKLETPWVQSISVSSTAIGDWKIQDSMQTKC